MIRPHLRSRFGRRLFLRFLLAALLPILALAAFAYHEMQKQLVDGVQRALREDSKNFGMEIVSDLSWRIELMREADGSDRLGRLSGFTWVGHAGELDAPVLTPAELDALERHSVAIRLGDVGQLLLMARSNDGRVVILGRLDPMALWQRNVVNMPYCIFDLAQRPLFCTDGLLPPARNGGNARAERIIAVDVAGERYLGAYWEARLDGLFGQGGFEVLMTAPESMLSAPLTRLRAGFAAMIVLAIGLAVGLSANQIRHQTSPLDALTRGVRRLARGQLDTMIQVPGDDEFALLGRTFNAMSGRLRNKFNMLRLMAELDQLVLASGERSLLTRTILEQVLDAIPCDGAGVLTLHGDGRIDYLRAVRAGGTPRQASRVPDDLVSRVMQQAERDWVDVGDDLDALLSAEAPVPGRRALVFPVRTHDRVEGALLLALCGEIEADEDLIDSGRALADRMSVADSSIAWEARLYRQAHYDTLTGLPNRMLLRDRVEQACARATRDGLSAAVLLIDFDDFKSINEALGHAAGDQFLIEAARRIERFARPIDTVARLAADEFVLLLPDIAPGEWMSMLDALSERLTDALAEPMLLEGHEVVSQASIGIAQCPDNASDFEGLIKLSDLALQEAKRSGRGGAHFYAQSMNRAVSDRFELSQALRRAIQNDELLLYYQPKVCARQTLIVGAEALVRWRSPARGLVSPGVFLPLVSELGLDGWLTDFVIERACLQMTAWDALGLPPIPVSVNIAPGELVVPDFCQRVLSALARHGLTNDRLELEILESAEVGEGSVVRDALNTLRAHRVRVALDDFGTGYSSLVYLTELPADVLKLDRAFIRTMVQDARQQSIVRQVIALARSLDFKVVAEGVEEPEQHALLQRMGCDQIQGFLFSRPLPAEELAERLAAQHTMPVSPES